MTWIAVTGASGFVGQWLTRHLRAAGAHVRAIDSKAPGAVAPTADQFVQADLQDTDACAGVFKGMDAVCHLAALAPDTGNRSLGLATINAHNSRVDLNVLNEARIARVQRFLFTSSAAVYEAHRYGRSAQQAFSEEDSFPAGPERGEGWQKLYSEQLCRYYFEECGLEVRIARLHNVYGPFTLLNDSVPVVVAACRKILQAPPGGQVTVWGDGRQRRGFCYVADVADGLIRLLRSNYSGPINLASDRSIAIRDLYSLVARLAARPITQVYDRSRATGPVCRVCEISRARDILGWEPTTSLETGLAQTLQWVQSQLTSVREPCAALTTHLLS